MECSTKKSSRERTAKHRNNCKERGSCPSCGRNNDRKNKVLCTLCSGMAFKRKLKTKIEVLNNYGGCKCSCEGCTETNLTNLSIDHINGDGNKQRKKTGSGSTFYSWLKRNNFPAGYRVLCFNCNLSKGFHGYCVHEALVILYGE